MRTEKSPRAPNYSSKSEALPALSSVLLTRDLNALCASGDRRSSAMMIFESGAATAHMESSKAAWMEVP